MAHETISTEQPGEPVPTTHTTVIRETGSSGGGMGILLAVVLLIAIIAGIYVFSRNTASENAKDNAVAAAASDVGNAAQKVGNAAEDAAHNTQPQQ